jgi:hypothetical protein
MTANVLALDYLMRDEKVVFRSWGFGGASHRSFQSCKRIIGRGQARAVIQTENQGLIPEGPVADGTAFHLYRGVNMNTPRHTTSGKRTTPNQRAESSPTQHASDLSQNNAFGVSLSDRRSGRYALKVWVIFPTSQSGRKAGYIENQTTATRLNFRRIFKGEAEKSARVAPQAKGFPASRATAVSPHAMVIALIEAVISAIALLTSL